MLPPTFNEKDFIIFKQNQNGRISGGDQDDRAGNEYTYVAKALNTQTNFNDQINMNLTSTSGE